MKTCIKCNKSKPEEAFRVREYKLADGSTTVRRRGECLDCVRIRQRLKYQNDPSVRRQQSDYKRSEQGKEVWRRHYAKESANRKRLTTAQKDHKQSVTLPSARNRGKEWTGPELEIALRLDLTAEEAALMLGRTFCAVQAQRRIHGRAPRKQHTHKGEK